MKYTILPNEPEQFVPTHPVDNNYLDPPTPTHPWSRLKGWAGLPQPIEEVGCRRYTKMRQDGGRGDKMSGAWTAWTREGAVK
eukprot:753861-Hanusia_phi.AAC.9